MRNIRLSFLLSESEWRIFRFIFIAVALNCVLISPAHAFFKKKRGDQPSKNTVVSDSPQYRVFYTFDTSALRQDSLTGQKIRWVELNFKIVDMSDNPGHLFERAQGGKVRFLDQDGFALASDYFLTKDFQKADLYGSLWVQKERVDKIVRADAVPLREGEMQFLESERQNRAEEKKREEETFQVAIGKLKTSPAPLPAMPGALKASPDSFKAPQETQTVSDDQNQKMSAIQPVVSPSPSSTPKEITKSKEGETKPSGTSSDQAVPTSKPNSVGLVASSSPVPEAVASPSASPSAVPIAGDTKPAVSPAPSSSPKENKTKVEAKEVKPSGDAGNQVAPSPKPSSPVVVPAASPAAAGDNKKSEVVPPPAVTSSLENSVTASVSQDKIASPSPEKEIFDFKGTTNEELKKTLSESDKKPPTQIQESPSKIPGIEPDAGEKEDSSES